jgi:ABC-type multidrug transport system fused ATPase/permease subunit
MRDCGGWPFWTVCAILFTGFETSNLLRAWWVRIWTGSSGSTRAGMAGLEYFGCPMNHELFYDLIPRRYRQHEPSLDATVSEDKGTLAFYLGIYVGISLAMGIVGTCRFYWSFLMSIKGSRILFRRTLGTVLRTPLRWLDTVPVGRILNRLTSDFGIIDERLAINLASLCWHTLTLLGVCVAATCDSGIALCSSGSSLSDCHRCHDRKEVS